MHTGEIEVSRIIVAAVPYNTTLLPQNTSLVGSVPVALYSKTIPMQRRRGEAGDFRGMPASTTTCTLLKFISKFRT
jgi:hypothetical protein